MSDRRSRQPHIPSEVPVVEEAKEEIVYREEDPRTRAARRAAELRDHGPLDGEEVNEFFVDPRIIPDGWSYEYKRRTVLGLEDPSYQVKIARAGWEPVPATRHPELMPTGYRGNTIERGGLVLMERPLEITEEAKARDLREARRQVRQKEDQLAGAPPGQFERDNKGSPLVKINRSYEAMAIPEK